MEIGGIPSTSFKFLSIFDGKRRLSMGNLGLLESNV
jgi:hypothetical protein